MQVYKMRFSIAVYGVLLCQVFLPGVTQAEEQQQAPLTSTAECATTSHLATNLTLQMHPYLTVSEKQKEIAIEEGRQLAKVKKPLQDIFTGFRAVKLKGRRIKEAFWLSPVTRWRKLGYVAEQEHWDTQKLALETACVQRALAKNQLIFEVQLQVQVIEPAFTPSKDPVPAFESTTAKLTDDTKKYYPSVFERYTPMKSGTIDGGIKYWHLPVGSYTTQTWYYFASYEVAFSAFNPDGSPRLTPATKTMTVLLPELEEQATFLLPEASN